MNQNIPLWVIASLGRQVCLKVSYVGPCETYLPGHCGVLTSIQGSQEQGFHVTVGLDAHDPEYWENFGFDDIRPVSDAVLFSLDLEGAYLVQLPSVDADAR